MVRRVKRELGSASVKERFRVQGTDFTRERVLTGPVVILLRLRGQKVALQTAVNKFFSVMGEVWRVVTASAQRQARPKVQPEVFVHLNAVTCEEYYVRYGVEGEGGLWHGQRVWGVEGSYLKLPETEETRREFRVQTNPYTGGEQGQALAAGLYDLRNAIGWSAALGPKQAEKNLLFGTHLAATHAGDVRVWERAYADQSGLAMLVAGGWHFGIRCPRQSFTAVNAFWAARAQERVVTLAVTSKARVYMAQHRLPPTLQVRLVKVVLASGEVEVLGTDLLAAQTYPAVEFKTIYGWRWSQETYPERLKNIFAIERFSGQSVQAIKQDFYGVSFLATVESILSKPAQAGLTAQGEARACRSAPQVNRAVSYVTGLDHGVQ